MMQSSHAIKLLNSLKAQPYSIRDLDISDNLIDKECMDVVGEYIQSSKALKNLAIGDHIGDKGLKILARYLQGNVTLRTLDLYGNEKISSKSINILKYVIETTNIKDIHVRETNIKPPNALIPSLALRLIESGSANLYFPHR